ncbi:MAG TPA: glycosyltransferase family 1 protein [Terriglobia bacterium]|nr:glycosyltransferase family 1 protein [Terriglobia bacterium]
MTILTGDVSHAKILEREGAATRPEQAAANGVKARLTIDARIWKAGIGTYTLNLLRAMRGVNGGMRISAIVRAEAADAISGLCDEIRVVDAPIYTLKEQIQIPAAARGSDLLHVPHYNVPALYRGPMVVTIHDLTHVTEPGYRNSANAWLYSRPMLKIAAKKALQVITDSEHSKQRIVERLGVKPEKVSAIYLGLGPQFRLLDREKAADDVENALLISRPYLLYVGSLKPHKNLGALLRAFALLRSRGHMNHALLLAGDDRKRRRGVLDDCARLGITGAVRHIPWVSENLLPQLYAAAELVVMPSTSEGFGLPVAEAMACGTPVVCSNAASLSEVGGDAVEYFDPYSVEDMAAAIERVLDSPARRAEMGEKGLRQAAKFTWEECARKHLEVYRRVLAS